MSLARCLSNGELMAWGREDLEIVKDQKPHSLVMTGW